MTVALFCPTVIPKARFAPKRKMAKVATVTDISDIYNITQPTSLFINIRVVTEKCKMDARLEAAMLGGTLKCHSVFRW